MFCYFFLSFEFQSAMKSTVIVRVFDWMPLLHCCYYGTTMKWKKLQHRRRIWCIENSVTTISIKYVCTQCVFICDDGAFLFKICVCLVTIKFNNDVTCHHVDTICIWKAHRESTFTHKKNVFNVMWKWRLSIKSHSLVSSRLGSLVCTLEVKIIGWLLF